MAQHSLGQGAGQQQGPKWLGLLRHLSLPLPLLGLHVASPAGGLRVTGILPSVSQAQRCGSWERGDRSHAARISWLKALHRSASFQAE